MHSHRRGSTLIYSIVAMVSLIGFVSLGVDFGRAQLVKTELRRTTDAAAHYAMQGISDGTWSLKAIASALENTADGTPVVLLPSDIESGTWSSGVFTPTGTSPNAVRITAHRSNSRGTAVPLMFAQVLGVRSCDVTAQSIAYRSPIPSTTYGLVGTASLNLSGSVITDSYSSTIGSYGGANVGANGDIATNGSVTLSGTGTHVNGDIDYGTTFTKSGSTVTGTTTKTAANLSYPSATAPASGTYTYYGAVNLSGGATLTLPGGTYLMDSITVNNSTLAFSGPATVYVNGAVGVSGALNSYQNLAGNLQLVELTTSNVNFNGVTNVTADVYAPDSTLLLSGTSILYGRAVSKVGTISGSSKLHYDTALPPIGSFMGGGNISLVK